MRAWASRARMVQDNQAYSGHGILRGLHCQWPHPQGKLVQVLRGEVFDVAVDIRRGSPWFGRWVGVTLSGENQRQFWVPPGFAHGYLVTGKDALFTYKCSDYLPSGDRVQLRWDDPDDRDRMAPGRRAYALGQGSAVRPWLRDIPADRLPPYQEVRHGLSE